jgi:hypothetical protein
MFKRRATIAEKLFMGLPANFEKDEGLLKDIGSPIQSNWKGLGL